MFLNQVSWILMKQEQDSDIFSNVTIQTWCSEVIIMKVDVKGFYSKIKYPVLEGRNFLGSLHVNALVCIA